MDYASKITHILNQKIPDIVGDDEISNMHRMHKLNKYIDILSNLLPQQDKYSYKDIERYLEGLI